MSKRATLVLLVVVGGAMFWLGRNFGSTGRHESQTDRLSRAADAAEQQRHANLASLEQTIRDQQAKVEARRKTLSDIVRIKSTIYNGTDPQERAIWESEKQEIQADQAKRRGPSLQDYVDAKRDYETDQELLRIMEDKLASEKTENHTGH